MSAAEARRVSDPPPGLEPGPDGAYRWPVYMRVPGGNRLRVVIPSQNGGVTTVVSDDYGQTWSAPGRADALMLWLFKRINLGGILLTAWIAWKVLRALRDGET